MKKALITGITGQDGSYLAELLLEKEYEIHGIVRRTSTYNRGRVEHLFEQSEKKPNIFLHYGDLADSRSLSALVEKIKPDEVYNLAAQSHVGVSFEMPEYTADVTGIGTLRLLDVLRTTHTSARFYQASSSEMFGRVQETPQKETTPFYPRSPYGVAKLFAYWITVNYRESYNMFASNGILFNHESPRRGENFVTRKITLSLANMLAGKLDVLRIGNLNAKRDWGYAKDYVEAMWMILQQEKPDDYVVATGETHTVREFIEKAFLVAGINLEWVGDGVNERGVDRKTNKELVAVDPKYFRPAEVDLLIGDPSKAESKLGWKPTVSFDELVRMMVESDLQLIDGKRK